MERNYVSHPVKLRQSRLETQQLTFQTNGKYDSAITPTPITSDTHKTRGNDI